MSRSYAIFSASQHFNEAINFALGTGKKEFFPEFESPLDLHDNVDFRRKEEKGEKIERRADFVGAKAALLRASAIHTRLE